MYRMLALLASTVCCTVAQTDHWQANTNQINLRASKPDDECGGLSSCSSCTQQGGGNCQWCPSLGKCQDNTAYCETDQNHGPPVTSSDGSCDCINPATSFDTCSSCIGGSCDGLGWCPSEKKCYYGPNGAPFNGSCPASGTEGVWTTSSSDCGCLKPTESFTTCDSCTNNCNSNGWCPSKNQCFAGNASQPYNTSCPELGTKGAWTTDHGQCDCTNPFEDLTTCDSCTSNCGGNAWCPSTGKCFYSPDVGRPVNGTTCPGSLDLGVLSADCGCINPILFQDVSSCEDCTLQNFTWCGPQGICQAAVAGEPACPPEGCQGNCRCLAGSAQAQNQVGKSSHFEIQIDAAASDTRDTPRTTPVVTPGNCTLCKPGYTNTASGCTERCAPNCGDCHPTNRTQCMTTCAPGFTNFPQCDQLCPPQCFSCGGSVNGSTFPSTQCYRCADPGAAAPHCADCLPYLCRSPSGGCSMPCDNATLLGIPPPPGDLVLRASYGWCDTCRGALALLDKFESIKAKLYAGEVEAAEVALRLMEMCQAIPPAMWVCDIVGSVFEAGDVTVGLVTWALDTLASMLLADAYCVAYGLCPPPCTGDRSDALVPRAQVNE